MQLSHSPNCLDYSDESARSGSQWVSGQVKRNPQLKRYKTHQIALVIQMNQQDQVANQCQHWPGSEQPVQKGGEEEGDGDDLELFIYWKFKNKSYLENKTIVSVFILDNSKKSSPFTLMHVKNSMKHIQLDYLNLF